MNIATVLQEQARRSPGRTAIVEPGRTISFAELDAGASAAAADLASAGVQPGMRALVFSRMSVALYLTLIGMFRRRVTAVFVDPSAGHAHLDACVRRIRPDAFVAIPRAHLLRLRSRAIRDIPINLAIGRRVPFASPIAYRTGAFGPPVEPCTPDEPAIITFTSGSTGQPKAAVRTHGFLLAQHRALVDSIDLAAGDVDLCTLPIFLLANLASGLTSVIPDADLRRPGSIAAGPVISQIGRTRPSRTVASPAFLLRIAEHANAERVQLESFTQIYTGGAPVFPATLDAIASVAPRAKVVAVYGSTEAEPVAEIERGEISPEDRRAMSAGAGLLAGIPVPSISLKILPDRWGTPYDVRKDEHELSPVLPGKIGEIVVSGEHVLQGYLDGVGDDETKIRVGGRTWHRTGDAGYLDDRGRLWLLGRCSAKATDSRGVLYPFAVECAAGEHPLVHRAAFVARKGQRVLAIEPRRPGDIASDLQQRLAWAQLDRIVTLDRIPLDRRHNAKVDYPKLLALLDRLS